MKCPVIIVFIYGLLVFAGGIIGYVQAGSFASLFMGCAFAFMIHASALAMAKNLKWGNLSALILSILLLLFFSFRLIKTGNFMPSGIMIILSLLVVLAVSRLMLKISSRAKPAD